MSDFDPRFSNEAEQLVIGGLMLDGRTWDTCGHLVRPEDFHRPDHRLLFAAIAELATSGRPTEPTMVADLLGKSGELEAAGGRAYIGQLYASCPGVANMTTYARTVAERATYRRVLSAIDESAAIVRNQDAPLAERVQAACGKIQDAIESDTESDVPLLYEYGREWLAEQEEFFKSGRKMVGLPTGFTDLDEATLGMPNGELIIIAARPSMGKSAFALNVCAHNASAGKSVFIASLEMPKSAVMSRFAAAVGRVNYGSIRAAKFDEIGPGLGTYAAKLRDWKLSVDDRPRLDVNRLESCLRAHRRRHGLDLAMVDYLQLMDMGRDPNRNNAVSACTRDLKILAGVLNIPILLLSQLNRDLEKRADKRPQMSDLRDSGSIEQDAHTLLFLYRDEIYNPNTDQKGIAEIIVGKARDSERGLIIPVQTQLDQMRFGNIHRDYYRGQQ